MKNLLLILLLMVPVFVEGQIIETFAGNNVVSNQNGISIFPNPANNEVTIASPDLSQGGAVVISNVLGQEIFKQTFSKAEKANVDVSSLPAGMYFVKVNGVYGGKFVKE